MNIDHNQQWREHPTLLAADDPRIPARLPQGCRVRIAAGELCSGYTWNPTEPIETTLYWTAPRTNLSPVGRLSMFDSPNTCSPEGWACLGFSSSEHSVLNGWSGFFETASHLTVLDAAPAAPRDMNLVDTSTDWREHPNLVVNGAPFNLLPSGTRVRLSGAALRAIETYLVEGAASVTTTLYWATGSFGIRAARLAVFDHSNECNTPAATSHMGMVENPWNGWIDWFQTLSPARGFEILSSLGSPLPAPVFQWPNEDLKNLAKAAPEAQYTRALLRVKFNHPLPAEATTFEAIEEFLKTLPPVPVAAPTSGRTTTTTETNVASRTTREEIAAGEYVEIEAHIDGWTHSTEHWTQSATVRVPLSVFEDDDCDAVVDYVREEVREADRDYGDSDQGESDDDGIELDTDLDDARDEASDKINDRNAEEDEE